MAKTTAAAAAATGTTAPAFKKPAALVPVPVGLAAVVLEVMTGREETLEVEEEVAVVVRGGTVVVAAVGAGPVGTGPVPLMIK